MEVQITCADGQNSLPGQGISLAAFTAPVQVQPRHAWSVSLGLALVPCSLITANCATTLYILPVHRLCTNLRRQPRCSGLSGTARGVLLRKRPLQCGEVAESVPLQDLSCLRGLPSSASECRSAYEDLGPQFVLISSRP